MSEKVVIIGGGIIGLSCAYYLRKKGLDITVLEKGEFGQGCSKGNMGWICPPLHEPVPSPGLIGTSIKWMLKRDSPLYIKPSEMPKMSNWLYQFWKYCKEEHYRKGRDALLSFNKDAHSLYSALESDGLQIEIHRKGLLFVFLNESELEHKLETLRYGAKNLEFKEPVVLSDIEVRNLEPNISQEIVGGILLADQSHVRPETVSGAFINWLTNSDAELISQTEVIGFERSRDKILSVITDTEHIEGDKFLLATGAWSSLVAKQLGFQLPIQAGKGYSITIKNPNTNFHHPMYLGDTRAGISPFNGETRIGGTMELSGINLKLDEKRLEGVRSSVGHYLSQKLTGDVEVEWTGMRPMTPDGLPLLGRIPGLENAFIATGHGMEGVSMSPATGKVMSDIVCGNDSKVDTTPFHMERFSLNYESSKSDA